MRGTGEEEWRMSHSFSFVSAVKISVLTELQPFKEITECVRAVWPGKGGEAGLGDKITASYPST